MTTEEEIELYLRELMETTNDTFLPLFGVETRFLVLKGGGGSGKSIFAGRKILERCTSEPGHRFLVVRKVAKTIKESCYAQLKAQISEHYVASDWTINKGDMSFTHKNGSQIITAGLDDVEKLKSIFKITGIWIEEASELEENDLRQLNIRLRGETKYYKQMILSFNPISVTHWLKKKFFDKKSPDVTVHESTYKDNRFLDEEQKRVLESFKDDDPYYYMVYCLGGWGVTGKTVFDSQKVAIRLDEVRKPIRKGYFLYTDKHDKIMDIKWVDDPNGAIDIYEEVKPGYPYVVGGDTAGEGSDFFTGHVLNNVTGKQAAKLKHQYDEDVYARQMYCLGMMYNTALIAIEANFTTHPIKELRRFNYPKQFVRPKEDVYTGKMEEAYGFKTTQITRPLILADLVKIVRESPELIMDKETLEEMLTFVRNEKGRPEAQSGAHDDLIMGLAIAYYARTQQRTYVLPNEGRKTKWTKDMFEDYRRASKADKQLLIEIWGEPEKWSA